MRKLITTIALLALIDSSVAIAQTVGSRNPSAPPPSTNPDKQLLPEAPVGHRQPRADQVPQVVAGSAVYAVIIWPLPRETFLGRIDKRSLTNLWMLRLTSRRRVKYLGGASAELVVGYNTNDDADLALNAIQAGTAGATEAIKLGLPDLPEVEKPAE